MNASLRRAVWLTLDFNLYEGELGMIHETGQVMVQTHGLIKDYGPNRAVKGISFEVSKGEVLGFLGPNGAGKSTTMKMLTGFLKPTSGSVTVGGIAVADEPLEAQRRIGYLPESAPMYDDMMVVDFLHFAAKLRGVPLDLRKSRLMEIGQRCGLEKVLGKDIGQLSKGYRQRVGLAQALVHDPDLLILDEPTSGLDPNQIVEIRQLIRELGQEKTVILSTHILPEVQATCSRIVIINDGELVADDTPEALMEQQEGGQIHVVVAPRNGTPLERERVQEHFQGLPGVRSVAHTDGDGQGTLGFKIRTSGTDDPRRDIFGAAVAQDWVLLDLHREHVSLEDTFRRLTQG